MYKCKECGRVFSQPKKYEEDKTPYGGVAEAGFIDYYAGCPECGGNYEHAEECDVCGQYVTSGIFEDGLYMCEECYEKD